MPHKTYGCCSRINLTWCQVLENRSESQRSGNQFQKRVWTSSFSGAGFSAVHTMHFALERFVRRWWGHHQIVHWFGLVTSDWVPAFYWTGLWRKTSVCNQVHLKENSLNCIDINQPLNYDHHGFSCSYYQDIKASLYGRHPSHDMCDCIFVREFFLFFFTEVYFWRSIDNKSALVELLAWRRTGIKRLLEGRFSTPYFVTRPK